MRFLIVCALGLTLSSVGVSQVPTATDESVTSKVDQLFRPWAKPDSPGCAIAVIKDGQLRYKQNHGTANLDHVIPIASSSVFNIASVSKQFTAFSIGLLEKQGKLSLDDDVRKYLTDFPQYQKPITIRHLVYQTSGIREYSHLMLAAGRRFQDAEDEAKYRIITRQKELNFNPGEEYLYSNSNYFLLARIVEKVSGKSFREFSEENIFKPLGMANTGFHNDATDVIRNKATGYSARRSGGFSAEVARFFHAGDGGLFTTIEDLFLWDQNFYNNKLGGPELIQKFVTPGILNSGAKSGYAFGVDVEMYKGLRAFGHDGVYNGYNAATIQFPEQKFSVVCLCNLNNIPSAFLARQIADIYLAGQLKQSKAVLVEPKIVQVPEKELAAVAGAYFDSANSNFRKLYVKNGKLIYSRGTSESELAPLGNNRFLMLGTPDRVEITFKSPQPGKPFQMITVITGVGSSTHDSVEEATYSVAQLKDFAGAYHSEEIDATYDIILRGEKLTLRRDNVDGETPLLIQYANVFSAVGTGTLRFTRDQQNNVTGFRLSTGRVRGLRFQKKLNSP